MKFDCDLFCENQREICVNLGEKIIRNQVVTNSYIVDAKTLKIKSLILRSRLTW